MNLWPDPNDPPTTLISAFFFALTLFPRVIIFAIGVCFEERRP